MVRLVVTDFSSQEEKESFYMQDDFDSMYKIFTYDANKQHSAFISKYEQNANVYSLNLLSKKHLDKNQLLIHVNDNEFYILFNHKTIYAAKINDKFITDDIIKSITITKHISMLCKSENIENIYYIISSKYYHATENILKLNTKNENQQIIAKSLGDIEKLVEPLNELDTFNSFMNKNLIIVSFIVFSIWFSFTGLNIVTDKLFFKQSLENINTDIDVQRRVIQRENILLRRSVKEYNKLTQCITKDKK